MKHDHSSSDRHLRPLQPGRPLSDDWLFADPFTVLGDDPHDLDAPAPADRGPCAPPRPADRAPSPPGLVVALSLLAGLGLGALTNGMSVMLTSQEAASGCPRPPAASDEVVTRAANLT